MWNNGLKKTENREVWLDLAKCFGILMVIINHLELDLSVMTFFGGMFYMPVFFVAAGYTYRDRQETYISYLKGKAKRLLLPYALCNILLVTAFTLRSGELSKPAILGVFYSRSMLMAADSSWNMALMPYLNAPTWFLTCLFLCLAFYRLLDRKFQSDGKRRVSVGICMAVGILLRTFSPVLLPWSLENALYFLGLLELGRTLKEGGLAWLRKNQWIYANFFMIFVVLSWINGSVNVSISEYGRSMILFFLIGALGSLLCMKAAELTEKYLKILVRPLAWIGRHTLPILCWHLLAIEIIKTLISMLR